MVTLPVALSAQGPCTHIVHMQAFKGFLYINFTGLLSNQGEKSINFHFIMVPLRKKY